jgi:hypothetical protein
MVEGQLVIAADPYPTDRLVLYATGVAELDQQKITASQKA